MREKELKVKNDAFLDNMLQMQENDKEWLDKISPMAFTEVMMKNHVGGFGTGTLLSDLRITL